MVILARNGTVFVAPTSVPQERCRFVPGSPPEHQTAPRPPPRAAGDSGLWQTGNVLRAAARVPVRDFFVSFFHLSVLILVLCSYELV